MANAGSRLEQSSTAANGAETESSDAPADTSRTSAKMTADDCSCAASKACNQMPKLVQTMIGIWIVTLSSIALAHLPWAWALAERFSVTNSHPRARWLWVTFGPQKASALLIVVILAAVIGSCAALALTFANRVGYNKLEKGWGWWYFTRPFTATAIGVLAYALLQAGFFGSGSSATPDLLAAGGIGGLAGLFTDQLLQKMRKALGLTAFLKSATDPKETEKITT